MTPKTKKGHERPSRSRTLNPILEEFAIIPRASGGWTCRLLAYYIPVCEKMVLISKGHTISRAR
jgi:hypothetical protein